MAPIARNIIIENMQEGMIVIDYADQIIDINPAARSLLISFPKEIIGIPLKNYLPEAAPLLSEDKPKNKVVEFSIQRDKTIRHIEAKLSIIRNTKGGELGYLLTLQDITERKQLFQEIERLASTDPLTNLNNRRHMFDLGEKEITRARRYNHPVSLLIIDIDHFKEINDTYGHLVGDQILEKFSSSLQSTFRSIDIVGRYGGDKFIVILPETPPNAAHATAIRLCETITNRVFQTTAREIHFTLSIGISSETDFKNDTSLYTLLERADRALYRAKSRGRNQAVLENNQ
ncbi:MAG: diguanylate cyclase [Chloroflexi bacterium]|nr:diguanylate cyclase [Chloroflexota bacterium]